MLKHTVPGDIHWDFMLESGDLLSTWRVSIPPDKLSCTCADAEKIFDHPKKFLTYQGPVNNGKGSVIIEDSGTYSIIRESEGNLQIQINAKILCGTFNLTKKSENTWKLSPT
jgi:hypothetical protein